MANWYQTLNDYFPAQEMKSREHFEILFNECGDSYKKDEGPAYLVVYYEGEDYIFIDYILVNGSNRGNGVGSRVIERFKRKGKPIILEVEPAADTDPDSKKRVRFYEKAGFKKSPAITYERKHIITGDLNIMDVFYWAPSKKSEEWALERMQDIYEKVHCYKAEEVYGKTMQPVDEVLSLNQRGYSKAK